MSVVVIPGKSLRYPVGQFEMNEKSWQARGLAAWFPMIQVGSLLVDLSSRNNHGSIAQNVSIAWSSQLGQPVLRALANSGQSTNGVALPDIFGASTPEASLALYVRNSANISGAPVDYTTDFNVHHYPFGGTDNGNNCYCNALTSSRQNVNDWLPNKDQWHWYFVRTKNGANNWQWWQDSRKIAQASGATNVVQPGSTRRLLASNSASNQGWGGYLAEARFYDRYLSDDEMIRLARAPMDRFELYKPRSARAWFIPPTTQTVTMDALAITPSLPNPTINQIVTVDPLSNGATVQSPDINQVITIDACNLNAAVNAPQVNQVVTISALSNPATPAAPTVNQQVTMDVLTITPTLPDISAGQGVSLDALASPATVHAPAVSQEVLMAGLANPATVYAPAVGVLVALDVLANLATVHAPTIRQQANMNALAASAVVYAPTVTHVSTIITPRSVDRRIQKAKMADRRRLKM